MGVARQVAGGNVGRWREHWVDGFNEMGCAACVAPPSLRNVTCAQQIAPRILHRAIAPHSVHIHVYARPVCGPRWATCSYVFP
eukprot:2850299-Pyramimonas_sp.AAC.1